MQGYNMEEASLLDSPLRREKIIQLAWDYDLSEKQTSVCCCTEPRDALSK